MPCYFPIPAWRNTLGTLTLREPRDRSVPGEYLRLPCGTCLGCRTSRSREWSLRCSLELQSHDVACWTTLTYDNDHLPNPETLRKGHLSSWLKCVRARVSELGIKVRFFASGEYGERTKRPHYHCILFGLSAHTSFQDSWPHGFARTDPLTPASIQYVAGYCSKKLGDYVKYPYVLVDKVDHSTGEIIGTTKHYPIERPFVLMSRNPGLASAASRRFSSSWRTHAIYQGNPIPVPRYLHQSWLKGATPSQIEELEHEKSMRPLIDTSKASRASSNLIAHSKHSLSSLKRQTL